MTPSILRGAFGFRAYWRASCAQCLNLNKPQTIVFNMERDPETGWMRTHSVEQRYAVDDRTRWPDGGGRPPPSEPSRGREW